MPFVWILTYQYAPGQDTGRNVVEGDLRVEDII